MDNECLIEPINSSPPRENDPHSNSKRELTAQNLAFPQGAVTVSYATVLMFTLPSNSPECYLHIKFFQTSLYLTYCYYYYDDVIALKTRAHVRIDFVYLVAAIFAEVLCKGRTETSRQ